jgi:phospho-N-acetylmuramoyl-pentapeptide-transferase
MLYLLFEALRDQLDRLGLERYFRILDQLEFRMLAASILAFLIVLLLGRPAIVWLVKKKIGDSGLSDADALRLHTASKANTPTMGGILVVGALIASTILLADLRSFYIQLGLVVALWLAVLGGVDDWLKLTAKSRGSGGRQGLFAWEKLVFQLGLGLLVGYFLYKQGGGTAPDLRHVLNLPFQKTYIPGSLANINPALIYLSFPVFLVLATLVVAGMSNAVNITDGMDGLAAGVSTAVALGMIVLASIAGDQGEAQRLLVPFVEGAGELPVLAGAMAGACLGFLWWNCSPAQVFMGDTGALALGGLIGYIAVAIRQEFVILLMSAVFLWELLSVAIQVGYFKMTGGKRVFRVAPYHHHLHLGGWTEQQVVARAWIASILLVALALASIKVR